MTAFQLIPKSELDRVRAGVEDPDTRLALLADMCRLNALVAVKRAGSGHLGSTFSALDIVVHLLYEELNVAELGFEHPDRDVFFSSKGHDVPGLYAALFGLGVIPQERLLRLRRLGGLDGHPDVGVPGIEANSGSLGMGISKGRGIAWAKWNLALGGRVVVMTGDGELQEGQNWEALQAAAHERLGTLWVIVDRNELQSDKPTEEIVALGDLEEKLRAFGWDVRSCDGHDHAALREVFAAFREVEDRPNALVARTVKGKGISFMERSAALAEGGGFYRWHAGAPGDDDFERAQGELVARIDERLSELGLDPLEREPVRAEAEEDAFTLAAEPESGAGAPLHKVSDEYVVEAYGHVLLELAPEHERLVVLDADLASDCRIREFELAYPDRFIECGIAEQDMVSTAAGLARHGLLPVVNSFASFLASRANEQIYNQASEGTKVVYALHYAGLIPAGPGKSHQSLRDVSLLAALPNMTIVQPGNAEETAALLRWAVEEANENVALRLAIGPSPRRIELPEDHRLAVGRGTVLRDGQDAVLLAYGPVMLHEALLASELLAEQGALAVRVIGMPWLNRFDAEWLAAEVAPYEHVLVLEDHAPAGALGDELRRELEDRAIATYGVEGWPACGTPEEALGFHGLDGASLAARIAARLGVRAVR
ncbi:MAG TPA: transketolase C-terminal domain-containing protein [Gaiellaceae bacterium]|nr:transketolase C-terminal domain-containing protein [Gaiellaceae bacterium]